MMQEDNQECCCDGTPGNSGWQVPVFDNLASASVAAHDQAYHEERTNENASTMPNTACDVSTERYRQLPKEARGKAGTQ